jgi:hypothetical protein
MKKGRQIWAAFFVDRRRADKHHAPSILWLSLGLICWIAFFVFQLLDEFGEQLILLFEVVEQIFFLNVLVFSELIYAFPDLGDGLVVCRVIGGHYFFDGTGAGATAQKNGDAEQPACDEY